MPRLKDDGDLVTADLEGSDGEIEEIDDFRHSRLLESIGSLDGKRRVHSVIRSEPAKTVSEFHVTTTSDKVGLHELVGALKNTASHGELKKRLNRIRKKKKIVATPLPKGEQEKIQRVVAYEQTSNEVSKWDPIVEGNRRKDQLSFPIEKPDVSLQTVHSVSKTITPFTSLEQEVAAALKGNAGTHLTNVATYTEEEEKALKAMSLAEAKERRAELQKYRALMSYRETRSRRQNKIKSKKYHRILRKEKDKQEKKRIEGLEKSDPEQFLEELKKVDTDRIEERMSLKHRGGSKFMKRQKMYAKYDDKARQSIQDMVDKNKQLTRKMAPESSSDEEEEEMEEMSEANPITPTRMLSSASNPWLAAPGARKKPANQSEQTSKGESNQSEYSRPKALKSTASDVKSNQRQPKKTAQDDDASDSDDEDVDIDKLFDTLGELEKEKSKEMKKKGSKSLPISIDSPQKGKQKKKQVHQKKGASNKNDEKSEEIAMAEAEDEDDEMISMSLSRKRTLEDMEDISDEETITKTSKVTEPLETGEQSKLQSKSIPNKSKGPDLIDPKKFLTIESKLKPSQLPNMVDEEEDEDEEEEHRMTISEAFASDDVVEEFNQEKQDLEEREKLKDIDLTLPGWGDWGGAGVQPNKRKRKKFTIEAPQVSRKDKNMDHIIISETKDTTISKHQVNKLPHFFKSIHQFESTIRAPIGKTWNPETSYRELIKPKVVTEIGKIIDPISKSQMYHKQQIKAKDFGKEKSNSKQKASPGAKRRRK